MLWLFFLYIPFPQLVCGVKMRNAICCTHFQDEERHRRLMWEENKKKIEAHNADYEQGKTSFYMGLNQFSDLVSETLIVNSVSSLRFLTVSLLVLMYCLLIYEDSRRIQDKLLWKLNV